MADEDLGSRGRTFLLGKGPSRQSADREHRPSRLPGAGAREVDLINAILSRVTQQRVGELESYADRLRPPYTSPLAGLEAVDAPTSRMVEQGFNRLPGPYQRAMRDVQDAPPLPLRVAEMEEGYNARGLHMQDASPPTMLAIRPETMAHELVHEYTRRRGRPWDEATDEALARMAAGQDTRDDFRAMTTRTGREGARQVDTNIRGKYPDPAQPGWLETLRTLIGGRR